MMRAGFTLMWGVAGLAPAACRGRPADAGEADAVARLVDSLAPAVERAVGLGFTRPPVSAVRSRDQVRAYLVHKLDAELPRGKARGIQSVYQLLGLFPDTLNLRALLLDLYTEQITGYYEPDSTTLFVVAGSDPTQRAIVVAHELVHALQHQYVRLDSIMTQRGDNDRLSAAHAVLEGQATLGGLQVIVPEQNLIAMPEFWETYRESLKEQQGRMPVFSRAPRIIREGVIFPYLAGADFLRWWAGSEWRDTVPFGRLMPISTEQILHPYRFNRGDRPLTLRFAADSGGTPLYEDVMGEFEIRVLQAELSGLPEVTTPTALGWGGDRYRLYETPGGPALVWYIAWDDSSAQARFESGSGALLSSRSRAGYRTTAETLRLGAIPVSRIVTAPTSWSGWSRLPELIPPEQPGP